MSELGVGAGIAPRGFHRTEEGAPGLSPVWLALSMCGILYGSLLPFRFDGAAFRWQPLIASLPLNWHGTTTEDVLTNILVYLPLGLAVVLCGRSGRRESHFARIPLAILIGATVGLLAETLQNAVAARVSSLTDVALNVIGTAVGAMLGAGLFSAIINRALPGWKANRLDQPFTMIAGTLSLGLLLYGLFPFDFVTDSASLHDSFRRARWDITRLRPVGLGEPPFAALVAQCVAAAWYAVLGYAAARSRQERAYTPGFAWAASVKHGVTLVCIVELMQLFTRSHQFDAASVLIRALGVVFGAWFAVSAAGWHVDRMDDPRRIPSLRAPLLLALVAAQIGALLLPSFDPVMFSMRHADLGSLLRLPFEALWHRPMAAAVADIAAQVTSFATLAATVAMLLGRLRIQRIRTGTAIAVTATAGAVEALQLCTASRHADPTGPVIALFSVFVVSRIMHSIQPPDFPAMASRSQPQAGSATPAHT